MNQLTSFFSLLKTAFFRALNTEIKFWGLCGFCAIYLVFRSLQIYVVEYDNKLAKISDLSFVKFLSLEIIGALIVTLFVLLLLELFNDKLTLTTKNK